MTNLFAGKRLVIFGCGYVGSAVALDAKARGAAVTALTRNAARAALLRDAGIEAVVADLAGRDWHGRLPAAPDFAVNCVSSGGGGIESYRRSYFEGMASILDWAGSDGPIGTLVYTSSTSVYPQGGGAVVDEACATVAAGSDERAAVLSATEGLLHEASPAAVARWFVLRLAGIYGPSRHHLVEQVRAGEVAGVGETRLNLIHRDDIVAAVLACLVAPAGERNTVFNVADDHPSRRADVVDWLAGHLGVPAPRWTGAAAPGRRAVTPDRTISNRKLKERLGWQPGYPSFREGYSQIGLAKGPHALP